MQPKPVLTQLRMALNRELVEVNRKVNEVALQLTDQANLTPSQAAALWPRFEALAQATGVQIVGPMFGDALVLRAARAYESVQPVVRPRI